MRDGGSGQLLEREAALEELDQAIAAARDGRGTCAVVEALPGLGKTALLRAAAERAERQGLRVLNARGAPLETGYGFGVVRQLLEPVVRRPAAEPDTVFEGEARFAERVFTLAADGPAPDRYVLLQALHRLTARLCAERPTLLVVDDAQWADELSLHYLAFLQHRLEGLPLGLVLAARPVPVNAPPPLLTLVSSAATRVRLEPLSRAATQELVRSLVPQASPEACAAAYEVTGGNPLYLRQLTFPGGRLEAPEELQALVARRVTMLGEDATAVVRAVHVLGRSAQPRLVARLAGVDPDRVRGTVADLVSAGVLTAGSVLEPVHPLVRDALGALLLGGDEAQLRLEAARLLVDEGRDVEEVAALLLGTEPTTEGWVAAALQEAGRAVAARGAPGAAVPYLRRALLEPLGDQSGEVLLALGSCEMQVGDPAAVDHLRLALDRAADDAQVTAAGLALARALTERGLFTEALEALRRARARLAAPDAEAAVRLDMECVTLGRLDLTTIAEGDRILAAYGPPEGDRAVDKLVLANLCIEPVRRPGSADEAVALARRALADGILLDDQASESYVLSFPVLVLFAGDELDEAARALARMRAAATRRGSTLGYTNALCWSSHVALRAGDVPGAEQAAREAIDHIQATGSPVLMPFAVAFLSDALVERGDLEQAALLWAGAGLDGDLPPVLPANYLLHSRGVLRLAQGHAEQAALDLAESGRREEFAGVHNPAMWSWRSYLALALHAVGRTGDARAVVATELAQARAFGARRAIGIALRTSGVVAAPEPAEALLREAVEVLQDSPARLELARAQVELGAHLRRQGRRQAARDHLLRGLDSAQALGAGALAAQARQELAVAGARPRRSALVGVAALTASERRVAELAARGLTNREIAARLVVSGKTVETHMHAVLEKLEVGSRKELAKNPDLLSPSSPSSPTP